MARRPQPWYRKSRRAWYVTVDGVQHHLGSDKPAAYELYYKLMRQPKKLKVASLSLADIADKYLCSLVNRKSPEATYQWYKLRLRDFVSRHLELSAEDLKPYQVQEWADENPNHAKATKRNKIRAIKRCLSWAVEQGYLDRNPIASLSAPSAEPKDQIVSPEQFEQMIDLAPDQNLVSLLRIVWETGCRPQECLMVTADHVDLANSRWVFRPPEAKGKAMPRIVYLTDTARTITEEQMAQYSTGPLFRNSQAKPWNKDSVGCACDRIRVRLGKKLLEQEEFQPSQQEIADVAATLADYRMSKGKRIQKTTAELNCEAKRKIIQRRARLLVPSFSLYTLRHSWATNALKRGVDALTVAILMGHKDPSTLARVYQHLSHNPEHLLLQACRASGCNSSNIPH